MEHEVIRLQHRFRAGRAELSSGEARLAPGRDLLARYAQLIDELVAEIFDASCSFADRQAARTKHSGLAIVATGGYGRRELNPFSDVDIAFIPSEEEDPWVESAVHMAFKLVMDVFLSLREVRVGYSYRPVPEASTWDLVTLTALLDARHLCGNSGLSEALVRQLRKHLCPLDLMLEFQSQSGSSDWTPADSLYMIEPNLKEGPGSLRDLHRARWLFKLLLGADDTTLATLLVKKGYLAPVGLRAIETAADWFWRARNWLHLVTGKRADILINNYQDRIAAELGGCSAQAWLSQHYEHAETLARFRASAVRSVLEGPLDLSAARLEGGYLIMEGRSGLPNPGSVAKVVHLSQRYSIPLSLRDCRALDGNRAAAERVREPSVEEAWAFLSILAEARQVAAAVRTLAGFGFMDRFIENFSAMMRFVPPDPIHRYTVGEHSIKILEHLENLRVGRDSEGQRFSEILSQCSHFDVLCLAALLHDAGKLLAAADHSEAAIDLVRTVSKHLKLPPEKADLLEILVRHHLLLVRTARLQDLKSPAVIQRVAGKVSNVDTLRHLYVFTYVDTRAVAENNWTSMDYRDLEDLYGKVHNLLAGPSPEEKGAFDVERRLGQIRRKLASSFDPGQAEAVHRHCESMPASYILNTPLDEIASHLQLLSRLESEQVVLDIYNRPGDDFSELTICAYDDPKPGMLAKIAGVLYACSADIHKAQVFTMQRGDPVVLDTLWIRSGGMQVSENRAARIRRALKDVLTGARTVEQLLHEAGRIPPGSIVLDSVDLRNDLSEEHTVVHVIARDLRGLLYLMTRALSRSGLHIHSAKVATWDARAENNFYVTTLALKQIPDEDLSLWRDELTRMFQGMSSE